MLHFYVSEAGSLARTSEFGSQFKTKNRPSDGSYLKKLVS